MPRKIKMQQPPNTKTLEDGFSDFLVDCEVRRLRHGTLKHYKDSMRQIYKIVPKETLIDEIDIDTWNDFKLALYADPEKNEMSAYTYGRDFKTVLRFFMRKEWLPPMELQIAEASKQPTVTYTKEELQKLLRRPNMKKCNFSEYKNWVMVNFLLSTGIRQNSLVNVKIQDLDFDAAVITVRVTKNHKPLILPMNSDIKRILSEYLTYRQANSKEDYLFCNDYGAQLVKSTVYHGLYWYNKNRGVETTGIHRYRHTFAKQWVMMGGNVVSLQKILGHSSLQITENYLNLLVSDMAKEVEEFNILRQFKQESIKMSKAEHRIN